MIWFWPIVEPRSACACPTQTDSGTSESVTSAQTAAVTGNSDPVLSTAPGGGTHYENAPNGVYVDTSTTITDADGGDFDGGTFTVTISGNGEASDTLYVRDEGSGVGQVGVSGSTITYNSGSGAVTVATVSGGLNGSDPLDDHVQRQL